MLMKVSITKNHVFITSSFTTAGDPQYSITHSPDFSLRQEHRNSQKAVTPNKGLATSCHSLPYADH